MIIIFLIGLGVVALISFSQKTVSYILSTPLVDKVLPNGSILRENQIGVVNFKLTSSDAFMVFNPITVDVTIKFFNEAIRTSEKSNSFYIKFHGAINLTGEIREGIDHVARVRVDFNEVTGIWSGTDKIIYQIPGRLPFTITKIENGLEQGDVMVPRPNRLESTVYVAPAEIVYQIQDSKIILFFSIAAILFTIYQIFF